MKAESLAWGLAKLDDVEDELQEVRVARAVQDGERRREAERRLEQKLVPVTAIAEYHYTNWSWDQSRSYEALMPKLRLLRGELVYAQEIEQHLQPEAPELRADRLHPWVWNGAKSLWSSGHYADAVETAAKVINAELQKKLGRRDISDAKLCNNAFSTQSPTAEAPRLRFGGDRTSETWRARQEGAAAFGRGAFMAIRNPLAHHGNSDLSEHAALEHLAVFSVIARWVEECSTERLAGVSKHDLVD